MSYEGCPPGCSQANLMELATHVGRLAGNIEQMNGQLGGLKDDLRQLSQENTSQHGETARQLIRIDARLEAGDERFTRIEKRQEAQEKRKDQPPLKADKDPGSTSKLDALLGLVMKYGAWLAAGGALLYGLISAWVKGDQPKP